MKRICRVCGTLFTPRRSDARTCSDACRVRLHRGQDLAYLADYSAAEQSKHRQYHQAIDDEITTRKQARAAQLAAYRDPARQAAREQRRKLRQEQAAHESERRYFESIGRYVVAMENKPTPATLNVVAAVLKRFVQLRRNDMSAEAIAAYLDRPNAYPVEKVAAALDDLRASGHYDRIVAARSAEDEEAARSAEDEEAARGEARTA